MNLNLMKTLKSIECCLSNENITINELKKAYEQALRLRSQLISVIYDMEQYIISKQTPNEAISEAIIPDTNKRIVTLVINEPLPALKELTISVEEHWVNMIHSAIAEESKSGIPKFQKAVVMIEITTPKGNNNRRVWDTSNRAINVIINNLKGIFFRDDDFEHMAFGVVAAWGEIGKTIIRIYDFDDFFSGIYQEKL